MLLFQCSVNGVKYSKLVQGGGDPVTSLEMFFSGYQRITGMKYFPNLTTVILMGQDISKIEGLTTCTQLKELWICECKIKVRYLKYLKYFTFLEK